MKQTKDLTDKEVKVYQDFLQRVKRGELAEEAIYLIETKHKFALDRQYCQQVIEEWRIVENFITCGFVEPTERWIK